MAEISREEAKVLLKDHEKWTNYSWIDDICEYAIKDMEKLEKIEKLLLCSGDCTECVTDLCLEYQIKEVLKGE